MMPVSSQDYSVPEISLFPEENAEGKKVIFRDTSDDARIFGQPIKANSIIISAGLWVHGWWNGGRRRATSPFIRVFFPAQVARVCTPFLPGCTAGAGGGGLQQPRCLGSGSALRGISSSAQNRKYRCACAGPLLLAATFSPVSRIFAHRVNRDWKTPANPKCVTLLAWK